eukprot:PhF_6_TR31764/c0_g1_i1/m.46769
MPCQTILQQEPGRMLFRCPHLSSKSPLMICTDWPGRRWSNLTSKLDMVTHQRALLHFYQLLKSCRKFMKTSCKKRMKRSRDCRKTMETVVLGLYLKQKPNF